MYGIVLVAIILILLAISGYRLSEEEKRRTDLFIRDSFGKASSRKLSEGRKDALQRLLDLSAAASADGNRIDELTWSDTGMEDIFLQMDNCLSAPGEEYLYKKLHDAGSSDGELELTDSISSELYKDEKMRVSLGLALHRLGFVKDKTLPEYLEHIISSERFLNPYFHIIADIFYIGVIAVLFFKPLIGALFLVALILVQISSYFSLRRTAEERLSGITMIMRLSIMDKNLPSDASGETGRQIADLLKDLRAINTKKFLSGFVLSSGPDSGNGLLSMLLTYINLLFHFDLIASAFLLDGIKKDKDRILSAYEKTGYLDMCLSIASYRAYLETKGSFCKPVFTEGASICIKEGFNPLIEKPVTNDAFSEGGVLITGSNASGKSTYMRMIAVNAILAQTVATCPAKEYRASHFRIYSSIAVNDSILKGESYFMAEIKSLKRIVDAAGSEGRPVICFIDEILRGTNTSERIAAACAVLNYLSELGVITFAATHDIELTTLVSDKYENVHFSENITDDDVTFNYVLEKGPTKSRNAIALLKKNGFPASVTGESEKLCARLDQRSGI
ncbi:MAG: hypothetical protein J6W48_10560 [Lachnospiraceae bacterium]|nr:hypothetical protein [Lachnospiraceae bacterium]